MYFKWLTANWSCSHLFPLCRRSTEDQKWTEICFQWASIRGICLADLPHRLVSDNAGSPDHSGAHHILADCTEYTSTHQPHCQVSEFPIPNQSGPFKQWEWLPSVFGKLANWQSYPNVTSFCERRRLWRISRCGRVTQAPFLLLALGAVLFYANTI